MIIRKINILFRLRKSIIAFRDKYAGFLKAGVYVYNNEKKEIIYLKGDKYTEKFVRSNFRKTKGNKKTYIKFKVKELLLRINIGQANSKKHNGSILMSGWNNDVKIFDFVKKEVLTFFSDSQKYKKYVSDVNYFSNYFNVLFIGGEFSQKLMIETLIENSKRPISFNEKKIALIKLINDYIKYFKGAQFVKIARNQDLNNLKYFSNEFNYSQMINKKQHRIPMYYMHSDLHFDNVLIYNETYYLIDWEHCSLNLFYFDIYNLFFIEVLHNNNLLLVKEYLEGNLDSHFNKLFNSAGVTFDTQERWNYFLVFLHYRYNKFDIKYNSKESVLKRYNEFLDKVLSLDAIEYYR